MISADDEHFHPRSDSPYWNESAFFQIMVPEREIDGLFYIWHRPNMSLSAGGVGVWDHTGEEVGNCLYFHLDEHVALPEDADMFDCTLPEVGLTVEMVEPLRSYRMSYEGEAAKVDLTWDAIMEPHELAIGDLARAALENPGGDKVNAGLAGWGNGHYDQAGRLRGTIALEDETIAVDSLSLRDHSWGPRRPHTGLPRGEFCTGLRTEDHHFHALSVSATPIEEDRIIGTTEMLVDGWYTLDGEQADLVSGTHRTLARGHDGRPLRVLIEAEDSLGRRLEAHGRVKSVLKFPCYAVCFQWFCTVEWELDGHTFIGEIQEYFYSLRRSRRFPQYFR